MLYGSLHRQEMLDTHGTCHVLGNVLVFYKQLPISSSQSLYKVGIVIIPIRQVRKLRVSCPRPPFP